MGEKAASLTRCCEASSCGKGGLHLLPQSAAYAGNMSQMQFTHSLSLRDPAF